MTSQKTGLLSLYIGIALMSSTGLFAKSIPLDAISITQLRSVVAIFALLFFTLSIRSTLALSSWRQTLAVYGLGLLMGVHWVTYFHSMQVSTVAIGMLSLFTYPIITVLMEPFFVQQKPALRDIFAGLILLGGVAIMTLDGLNASMSSAVLGAFWGVISAFSFSLRNTLQKYCFKNVPSSTLMFHQVLAVSLGLVPFLDFESVQSMPAKGWLLVVALGVLCSATAHTLLSISLKHLRAKSVALISCLQPIVGATLAWLLINEPASIFVLVGGGIILSVAAWESYFGRANKR